MMSGLFEWMVVFNWGVLVILLTMLVLIRIALSVFRFSFFVCFGGSVRKLDHKFVMCYLRLFCQ